MTNQIGPNNHNIPQVALAQGIARSYWKIMAAVVTCIY